MKLTPALAASGLAAVVTLASACGGPDGLNFGTGGGSVGGGNVGGGDGGAGAATGGGDVGCEVTGCPNGEFCEASLGCQKTEACTNTKDCTDAFRGDPCKTDVACNTAQGLCEFAVLDGDADGYPPVECGGQDCDDGSSEIHPDAVEACDGTDNNCDGDTDGDAECSGLLSCFNAACVCPTANACGTDCVDKLTDETHCGACNSPCPASATCQGGECFCGAGLTLCGSACVNTMTDTQHCGACNSPCAACNGGTCACGGDLYLLADLSGSMTETFVGGQSRWDVTDAAIGGFVNGAGTGRLGIGYFPLLAPTPPTCMSELDCNGGLCFGGTCIGGTDSCSVPEYATPSIGLAPLPGVATSIIANLALQAPDGGTPMVPAVQGALQYVAANASGPGAVVLITDGTPNSCTPATVAAVSAAASTYANQNPPIRTYVVGLTNIDVAASDWHAIAQAGGTGTAFTVATQAQLTSALSNIKQDLTGCL